MIPLGNEVFYVLRAPVVVDPRDNSEYRDWVNADRFPVIWSMILPFQMSEKLAYANNRDREYSQQYLKVYAPPGTDVLYTDRVEYWGELYVVVGSPGRRRDFDGVENHVEFIIEKILG